MNNEKDKRIAELEQYITSLEEECENLHEQIRMMVTGEDDVRICSVCGNIMHSGYLVDDSKYYCSDKCLHEEISAEEYNEMYENGSAFWTEWN